MTYDITIKKQGSVVHTIEGVEAPDALAAIDKAEEQNKQTLVQLLGHKGFLLEFQARRLDFSLS